MQGTLCRSSASKVEGICSHRVLPSGMRCCSHPAQHAVSYLGLVSKGGGRGEGWGKLFIQFEVATYVLCQPGLLPFLFVIRASSAFDAQMYRPRLCVKFGRNSMAHEVFWTHHNPMYKRRKKISSKWSRLGAMETRSRSRFARNVLAVAQPFNTLAPSNRVTLP